MIDAPAANPDLVQLHAQLVVVVQRLDAAIGDAMNAGQISAISDEITEVNARVTNIGRQLLRKQTATITRLVGEVTAAIRDVEQTIAEVDDLKVFVNGMTDFLKLVDQVVDAAKLVV